MKTECIKAIYETSDTSGNIYRMICRISGNQCVIQYIGGGKGYQEVFKDKAKANETVKRNLRMAETWKKLPMQQLAEEARTLKKAQMPTQTKGYSRKTKQTYERTNAAVQAGGNTKEVLMPYWKYKKQYESCKTKKGSYDADKKTVIVMVPA